jgi:hypothetical protein
MSKTVAFVVLLAVLCTVQAKVNFGSLITPDNWHYIGRFCYSNINATGDYGANGSLNYTITTTNKNLTLLIYQDYDPTPNRDFGDWDTVYDNDTMSCMEKQLRVIPGAIFPIPEGEASGWVPTSEHNRPRYFHVAVADCSSTNGINIGAFQITYLQDPLTWDRQFSYDEQGLLQLHVVYFIFYCLLMAAHVYGTLEFIRKDAYHPILRILTAAIALELLSDFCMMIHYAVYKNDGLGVSGLNALGTLFNMGAELMLIFMLILISKGWAITSNYLPDRNPILIAIGVLFISYMILFIWDKAGRDPASTLYFYESVPGIFLLIFRVLAFGWLGWSLRTTLTLETLPEKRRFYAAYGIASTAWFLLLPLFVIIITGVPAWYRFKTIEALASTLNFVAVATFAFLLWPSRAADYFTIKPTNTLISEDGEPNTYGATTGNDL